MHIFFHRNIICTPHSKSCGLSSCVRKGDVQFHEDIALIVLNSTSFHVVEDLCRVWKRQRSGKYIFSQSVQQCTDCIAETPFTYRQVQHSYYSIEDGLELIAWWWCDVQQQQATHSFQTGGEIGRYTNACRLGWPIMMKLQKS